MKKSFINFLFCCLPLLAGAQNITFADATVKAICVANWDTNQDGELSYEEAAAVKNLVGFSNNSRIKTFQELQYFTGLTSINDFAFEVCPNLTSIIIPKSVASIGDGVFAGCSTLMGITIPEGVTSIGDGAFYGCPSLMSITIPESVTTIGVRAFFGCSNLTSVTVEMTTPVAIDAGTFSNRANATLFVPAGCKAAYEGADYWKEFKNIVDMSAIGTNIWFNDNEVKAICVANWDTNNDGELSYEEAAAVKKLVGFSNNSRIKTFHELQYFTGLTSIDDGAFAVCSNLTSIIIPKSVASIGEIAFAECPSLMIITIPNSVTSIGRRAFYGCSGLLSITIPESVTSIGEQAFDYCYNLTSVTVEKTTPVAIDAETFSNRANATLFVPAGCKAAYEAADYWKEFKEIVEVSTIGTNIEFSDNEVKAICVANWDTNNDGELSYDEAAAVKKLVGFSDNNRIKTFQELQYFTGLTSIDDSAFRDCSSLTSINIPEGVTSIGRYSFRNCTSLTSITIPEGVTNIGEEAFVSCGHLMNITIPESVIDIGYAAFAACFGLTSISIPKGVTSIGEAAFSSCRSLMSINIPESVTSIDSDAFYDCPRLTSIVINKGNPVYTSANGANAIIEKASNTLIAGCKSTIIPESVTRIGSYAFGYCSDLSSITIPNSVTSIGRRAFDGCSGLLSITIPESVTSIGGGAFRNCSNLTSVTVEMTTPVAIVAETFSNRANATLHVPAGCKAAYESADIWKEFKEIVEVDASNGTVDNTLTFHYAKESVYWHYPQDLLIQLKFISSDNNRFAADYDFRSGYDFDFEDGRYRSYTDSILIQVSPDLDLTYSEIALLNSDNEDIISAGLVVVTEVKRHDDAGQWVIKFKLQDGKIDALLDKYLNGKYAVSVDNNIVTGYDVSLELVKTGHAYDFNVNGVSVAGIHNRYTNTEQSPNGTTIWTDDPDYNPNSFCYEMTWHGGEAYSTILFDSDLSESDLDDRGLNTCNRHGHSLNSPSERKTSGTDNRQNQPILPVAPNCTLPGEDGTWIKIDIEFPDYNEEGKFTPIRGFFVTLDNHFAIEGGNSEKNAWAAYEYRNVAKYSYNNGVKDIYGDEVLITPLWGNKGSIYIKKTNNVIGDVIGFRVHAVNLDGTLTDPDGRAFYVVINDSEQDLNPLDEDDNVDYSAAGSSINEKTDLTGTVVNNMYYNIGTDAGGFSAEDGCIVITKETSDEQMEALEGLGITDEELKQNFTGIIFKVPAGKGKVAVTAETTGNMTLKVKVGNDEPMEMELSGKLKIRVPYNVTEETMVYIFAGTADEGASRGQQRASSGDSSLRIYGIELEATLRGDVNGDTTVDAADVTALADYIVGNGTLANEAAAYVNDDDKIDIADLAALIEIIKNM